MQGHLKIYLGYAPHTGKTWRLLEEARRRKIRGQDVVVGWVRKKDRPALSDILAVLEVIPPCDVDGQPEMDVDAILRRRPYVCVIDELAHENAPHSKRRHRWQDVEALLEADISVLTALDIQYVAGLQDRIAALLGTRRSETVPDEMLNRADEVSIVDATLESMSRTDLAPRDLLTLRELALLYTADALEEEVQEYRQEHHIGTVWETRERILACLTPNPRGTRIVERAYQTAQRWKGELWAVYVTNDPHWESHPSEDAMRVKEFLELARTRGARVEIVIDADPTEKILSFARQHDITQIFVGHATAYPFHGALSRTVAGRIIHAAERMDVHLVANDPRQTPRVPSSGPPMPQALARLLSRAPRTRSRGHERLYLGYAPGVGKTYQMLSDGQYLRDQGQDVVVGACETRGRSEIEAQMAVLETIPMIASESSGNACIDVDAVLRRRPQVCLVDGLAESGQNGQTRWKDAQKLLDAGIHVFGTLDISEVESLKDTVERITGETVGHSVPDWVVDEADELLFVDVATRALLNRIKRGAIFSTADVPEALQGLFTEGSLNALRELAVRLTAERVEDALESLRKADENPVAAGEAVLTGINERPSSASLIRRSRRTADRLDAPCYVVYVAPDEEWTGIAPDVRRAVEGHLELARSLHVETHLLTSTNVARAIVDFAIRHGVTQVFVGRSRKTGWREFFRRSVIEQIIRLSPWVDIHVVADR